MTKLLDRALDALLDAPVYVFAMVILFGSLGAVAVAGFAMWNLMLLVA